MNDRQRKLLALIERATGNEAFRGVEQEEGEDAEYDVDTFEADRTISSS